jgi:branched-subunit amino acid aminotransferase/4-amino-4-deoxychorismate lyase
MHAFVSLNQKILSPDEAKLPAISSAAFYGKGVFTTAAIYRGNPFLWEKHWQRLNENAAKIGIDLSGFSEETVKDALSGIIDQNGFENGRARITFFDETASGIWSRGTNRKTSFLITTADFREAKNLSLTVSPYRINSKSPLANVKSCNYLENILALEAAKASGFDEAVRLNERGEAASACLANLFWIKDGQIFTPALETGCLAGTTRSLLLEICDVEEKTASAEELNEADEIFLTSAGIGIGKVGKFENKIFKGELTNTILDKAFPFHRSFSLD